MPPPDRKQTAILARPPAPAPSTASPRSTTHPSTNGAEPTPAAPAVVYLSPRTAAAAGFSYIEMDMSWDWDDAEDDEVGTAMAAAPVAGPSRRQSNGCPAAPTMGSPLDLKRTRPSLPPSSPSPQPQFQPQVAPRTLQLSPRTAAAAGFSTVDLDLCFDDDDDDEFLTGATGVTRDMPPPPNPPPQPQPQPLMTPMRQTPQLPPTVTAFDRASHPKPQPQPFMTPLRPELPPSDKPPDTPLELSSVPIRRRRLASSPPPDSQSPVTRPLRRLRRRPPSSPAMPTESDPGAVTSPLAPAPFSPAARPRARSRGARIGTRRQLPLAPAARGRRGQAEAALMDLDAHVSGSDASSDESSGEEDESDRAFAGDFAPTQAVKGYNQAAAYVAGLSTQACARQGLAFANHTENRTQNFLAKARRAVLISDDEREDESENEYELGSFVCDDDEELAFVSSQTDPLGSGI